MKRAILFLLLYPTLLFAQEKGIIYGKVRSENKRLPFTNISVKQNSVGTISSSEGEYRLELEAGDYRLVASFIGYEKSEQSVSIKAGEKVRLDFTLAPAAKSLKEVVISDERAEQFNSKSLLLLDKMNQQQIKQTQAMNLAEAVQYMPAVRIENNCQNCGFTQLRINGMPGSYSQLLINDRPVFSAMTSIYGLEQIPTAMIESIEVIRNGGSALHSANAIAGTVNIITKEAVYDRWSIESNTAAIDEQSMDQTLNFHLSLVDDNQKSGIQLFGSKRNKSSYDANGDGFSELPLLRNNAWGASAFYQINTSNKITVDFSSIEEYRRGGDRLDLVPHFTDISEEIQSQNTLASINHQWKTATHELSSYLSYRQSRRQSYYGGLGGGRTASDSSLAIRSYGHTEDYTIIGGSKWLYRFHEKALWINGIEVQLNKVVDEFPAFDRKIDQQVVNPALFSQLLWNVFDHSKLTLALRADQFMLNGSYQILNSNYNNQKRFNTLNPRISFRQELNEYWEMQFSYASGFRAPQTFNEDLHIATAAGESVFTTLSEDLIAEQSDAYNAELTYEKALKPFDFQFTAEMFYTEVNNTFTTINKGSQANGAIVNEFTNGTSTSVYGSNLKMRLKKDYQWSAEFGLTHQKAHYAEEQLIFENEGENLYEKRILRTPNHHAYLMLNKYLNQKNQVSVNGKYIGSMLVPRLSSNGQELRLIEARDFIDLNIKYSHDIYFSGNLQFQWAFGIQNLFDQYQDDFSSGPKRDASYIYGPMRPRTYFISLKIGSFN